MASVVKNGLDGARKRYSTMAEAKSGRAIVERKRLREVKEVKQDSVTVGI